MENVFIKESDSKFIEFFAPEKHHSLNQLDYFSVRFKSHNVEAVVRVYAYKYGHGLATLFHKLAQNWRGYDGNMEWAALDGEFSISCTITKLGEVKVNFCMMSDSIPGWELTGLISFGSGQLEMISKHMEKFCNMNSLY